MSKVGKVDKPAAGDYIHGRKAYIVRLLQHIPNAPQGYAELYEQYWSAVGEQLAGIEAKTGVIKHIFCEGMPGKGEDAKVALERSNAGAFRVLKTYLDSGIKIAEFEDTALLFEVIDWTNCMTIGLISEDVAKTIQANYQTADEKRKSFQLDALDKTLKGDEAALILVTSQIINLPDDVQRFLVTPPELDKVERWLREAARQIEQQRAQAAQGQAPPNAESPPPQSGSESSSGLWTPN